MYTLDKPKASLYIFIQIILFIYALNNQKHLYIFLFKLFYLYML